MTEIKNLNKAAQRIVKAIDKRENIVLYGDADLDGVTSIIILKETINNLGAEVSAVYFPDREFEGYGISEIALNFLKDKAPALLIAADCGIGNFKEVKLAKKLGFEVIILDHHEVLDKLPQTKIIVDPKQKGDKYPFKQLAAVGIIFKLAEVLLKDKMTESIRRNFLELVALATIADMMPQKEDNKLYIDEGVPYLKNSWRPGIKGFFETEEFKEYNELQQKISKIISVLNIRDVKNRLPASYRLLTIHSAKEAEEIIVDLLVKNKIRKENIGVIIQETEKRLIIKDDPIVFEGDSFFELALISSAASVISQKYQKPTFLFKKMIKESQGTVRAPSDVNTVALMKKCSKYLLTFGGHPQASGFRIKNENIEKFKECLIKSL